jgi:hypothetical protein
MPHALPSPIGDGVIFKTTTQRQYAYAIGESRFAQEIAHVPCPPLSVFSYKMLLVALRRRERPARYIDSSRLAR